ncbi:MAG: hypothetical protein ACR2PX_08395 [Endozoicomonas sp.]|uniref:hypothetical protein n=1 Tax=Endozoicomonas sp. TaxID=1892382 RepID=UPI003D9B26D9
MSRLIALMAVFCSILMLSGCVNTPTEMAGVKDDRPYIMFSGVTSTDMIRLDGIQMGKASDYIQDKSGMRIEPGTHRIEVLREGEIVLEQKFYLSRGSSKTFSVHKRQSQ